MSWLLFVRIFSRCDCWCWILMVRVIKNRTAHSKCSQQHGRVRWRLGRIRPGRMVHFACLGVFATKRTVSRVDSSVMPMPTGTPVLTSRCLKASSPRSFSVSRSRSDSRARSSRAVSQTAHALGGWIDTSHPRRRRLRSCARWTVNRHKTTAGASGQRRQRSALNARLASRPLQPGQGCVCASHRLHQPQHRPRSSRSAEGACL